MMIEKRLRQRQDTVFCYPLFLLYVIVAFTCPWNGQPSSGQVSAFSLLSHPSRLGIQVYRDQKRRVPAMVTAALASTPRDAELNELSETQRDNNENNNNQESRFQDEADRLLAKARALRKEISATESTSDIKNVASRSSSATQTTTTQNGMESLPTSPWNVATEKNNANNEGESNADYRLCVDIGREPGTWMEPRWGASGNRIEFTLDVRFNDNASTNSLANKTIQELMVQDNLVSGQSSHVYTLQSASFARLRNGFDRMACHGGGYRIDTARKGKRGTGQQTVRFFVQTQGIGGTEGGNNDGYGASSSSYGDVTVPGGCLYFSVPMFVNSLSQLSKKEGIVSVRQGGWNTGWYRQESRIVGVFRAVPIEDAKRRDGF